MSAVEKRLAALTPNRREEALALDTIFRDVTGWKPAMWGKTIGYGSYAYRTKSGREGTFLATGFAPLATKLSLHILPGYNPYEDIAARLGPHRRGVSCWYIQRLGDANEAALRDLIRAGLMDLTALYPVEPS